MNETDFEHRLRGHFAAKASLIEVPDHQFVQTRIVPFQPRRRRINTVLTAAAGMAVVAILGFGLVRATAGGPNQAGIFPRTNSDCQLKLIGGQPGYFLTVSDANGKLGSYASDEIQTLLVKLPITIDVYDSTEPDTTVGMVEASGEVAQLGCGFDFHVGTDGTLNLVPVDR